MSQKSSLAEVASSFQVCSRRFVTLLGRSQVIKAGRLFKQQKKQARGVQWRSPQQLMISGVNVAKTERMWPPETQLGPRGKSLVVPFV